MNLAHLTRHEINLLAEAHGPTLARHQFHCGFSMQRCLPCMGSIRRFPPTEVRSPGLPGTLSAGDKLRLLNPV